MRLRLVAILLFDLCGLRWLHILGAEPWARPSLSAPPEDAVMALLRVGALVLGWWLVASTALYAATRLGRSRGRLADLAGRVTVPAARRLVEGALTASLVVGPAAVGVAAPSPPAVVLLEQGPPRGQEPRQPPATSQRAARPAPPHTAHDARRAPPPDHRHVVQPGEHLWAIAASTVRGAPPDQVARYWRRLVELNRHRLRSDDPDLVYPGEVVHLPVVDA